MRIPQYLAQQSATTRPLPAARGGVVDVSGLVSGIKQGAHNLEVGARRQEIEQRQQEAERKELEAVQKRESDRLALNEAKLHATNVMTGADSFMNERFQKSIEAGPANAAGFTDGMLKEWDRWAEEQVKAAPEVGKIHLQEQLGGFRSRLHNKSFAFEIGQRNSAMLNTFSDGVEEDARNVYANPASFGEVAGRRIAAARSLEGVTPDVKAKAEDDAKSKLAWAAASKQAETDPAGFIKRARAPNEDMVLAALKPEALRTLDQRAQTEIDRREQKAEMAAARAERAAERHMRNAEASFNAFQALADKGTMMDPAYLTRTLRDTAGTPYQQGVAQLSKQANEAGGIAAAPVRVQQDALDQINTRIAQQGRSPELDKRKTQIEAVLNGSRRDLKNDALRAGLERGVITDLQPIKADGGMPQFIAALPARVPQAQQVGTWAGQAVSPFTTDEADGLLKTLRTQPRDQRAASVAQLAGAMGPEQAGALARQLDEKDRALGIAFGMAGSKTSAGRYVSELVLHGAEAAKDGTSLKNEKQPDIKSAQWKRVVTENLEGVYPTATLGEATRDAALYIAHSIAAEKGGRLTEDDMHRAAELAAGGSILEHNGRRTVMPGKMDEDELDRRLRAIAPDAIAKQTTGSAKTGAVVRAGGVEVPVADFVKTLPGAELVVTRPGKYNVIVGGRPVMSADGKRRIEIGL